MTAGSSTPPPDPRPRSPETFVEMVQRARSSPRPDRTVGSAPGPETAPIWLGRVTPCPAENPAADRPPVLPAVPAVPRGGRSRRWEEFFDGLAGTEPGPARTLTIVLAVVALVGALILILSLLVSLLFAG